MRKIALTLILSFVLVLSTGCELTQKIPGNNTNTDTNTSTENQEPELNASDHIFDINLERIRTDLAGKKLGLDKEWTIKAEDIIDSEFGGSSLANGKMESRYYLKMKRADSDTLVESAVTFSYNWDKNKWIFKNADQAYIEALEGEAQSLDAEIRKEKMEAYKNRPAAVPEEAVDAATLEDNADMEAEATAEEEAITEPDVETTDETTIEEETTEDEVVDEVTEEDIVDEEEAIDEETTTEEVTQ